MITDDLWAKLQPLLPAPKKIMALDEVAVASRQRFS
jgi:hypothetical protein